MPVLLFGGKFLKLKGGSYLQLGDPASNSKFSPGGKYSAGPAPYMSDFRSRPRKPGSYDLQAYGDAQWNTGKISGIYS